MAKRKKSVPSLGTMVPKMPTDQLSLQVPYGMIDHGYEARRVDVQSLTQVQRRNLKAITNGLVAQGSKLTDGRTVKTNQDAIKWILESLSP